MVGGEAEQKDPCRSQTRANSDGDEEPTEHSEVAQQPGRHGKRPPHGPWVEGQGLSGIEDTIRTEEGALEGQEVGKVDGDQKSREPTKEVDLQGGASRLRAGGPPGQCQGVTGVLPENGGKCWARA